MYSRIFTKDETQLISRATLISTLTQLN